MPDHQYGTTLRRWLLSHIILVLTVLLPTLVALIYFGLIASDVYISEARFVVRSEQQAQMESGGGSAVSSLLQSSGLAHSSDESYPVQDFMRSRDAVRELDAKLGIRKHYGDHSVDLFSRYPGWDWNGSFENFLRYYRQHVNVSFDTDSSISVLTVRAYSAEQAQRMNEQLLQIGERVVNSLNERMRLDMIRFAEQDVTVAADEVSQASKALFSYRSKNSVFEPNKQAEIEFGGIQKLQEQLIDTQSQIVELIKLTPSNPQISALKGRLDSLREAIAAEIAKVTTADNSLSLHAARMDRLLLDLQVADRVLGSAMSGLEAARSRARRQELYLDRVVEPNLPDYPMEPRRVRAVLTVLAVGLMLWGVVSLVLAAVREHTD